MSMSKYATKADYEAAMKAKENDRDAKRYRWLAERFTGFDADWMADEENGDPGKFVLVFNAPDGFRVGRDIGPCIDEWLARDGSSEGAKNA